MNTLGEVPDSAWYTESAACRSRRWCAAPETSHAPAMDKPWSVLSGKNEGITPGLVFRDSAGRRYFLKFDPKSNPEMASAADVIGSKFFYALGYNVPENYIVYFTRGSTGGRSEIEVPQSDGPRPADEAGGHRRCAAEGPARHGGAGTAAWPACTSPATSSDPSATTALARTIPTTSSSTRCGATCAGLYVFAAWLNHTDTKSINSLDSIVEENGDALHQALPDRLRRDSRQRQLRGQEPARGARRICTTSSPRHGSSFPWGCTFPDGCAPTTRTFREIGHLEYETFDPETLAEQLSQPGIRPAHARRHLLGRQEGDVDFATRRSAPWWRRDSTRDAQAVDWTARCLIERRNRIGRAFLNEVLAARQFRRPRRETGV